MKELYIPRGKTVTAAHIEADIIIVKGALNVDGTMTARKIMGDGILRAGHISAQTVTASDIEAGTVTAQKVAVDRLVTVELRASRSAAVTCYLEAGMVETPKLTVHGYEVEELKVQTMTQLPDKRGGLLLTILASELRTAWAALRCWWEDKTSADKAAVLDAECTPTEDNAEVDTLPEPDWEFERKRLCCMFDLAKERGYVLRVLTREESQSPIAEVLKGKKKETGRPAA